MSADPHAQRPEILEFLGALARICVGIAFFGVILAFFPVIYIGSWFGNQAALTAIALLCLIVIVASLLITWKWGHLGISKRRLAHQVRGFD